MLRRLARLSWALAVLTPLSLGQTSPSPVPVQCGHAADRPADAPKPKRVDLQKIDAGIAAGKGDRTILSMDEPVNLGLIKLQIAEYVDCAGSHGCYWTDLETQAHRAQAELKRLVATRKPGEKLAMVLDIDETSLSSYCEEKREDYGFINAMYQQWLTSTEASIAIPGTRELYMQARAAGVDVYFITGRPGVKGAADDQTEATARNLMLAGYKDWQGLILRDESERSLDTAVYKSNARKKIAADHRIILNVGDQWSDLVGAPQAEISVKMPNPYYFLPGDPLATPAK